MTNTKTTKRALLASILSLVICLSMLASTTFAWFTDTASTGVNTIQSGTLKIDLVKADGTSVVGKTLDFVKADGSTEILWEPGCTYYLPELYVKNMGNLAFKYQIVITGINGDAKLNEAIEWTIDYGYGEGNTEGHMAGNSTLSAPIKISGHMKEDAGNEYQNLKIDGISITVYATQDTVEFDSFDNQYDKYSDRKYDAVNDQEELNAAIAAATEPTVISMAAGTYKLVNAIGNKDIAFVGTDGTKFDLTDFQWNYQLTNGTTLTFDSIDVAWSTNNTGYQGFTHSAKVVYDNCVISGTQFMYSDADFIDCTFNTENSYAVYGRGVGTLTFTGCDFNTGGRAIMLYEDQTTEVNVVMNDCVFTDNGNYSSQPKAVVETGDGEYKTSKFNITINNCTACGFDQNGMDNVFVGNKDSIPADRLTVVIDNVNAVATADDLVKIGTAEELFAFAEDVNVNKNTYAGKVVMLTADIDLENKPWTPVGQTGATQFLGTFDGQGYTISNLTIDSSAQTGGTYSSGLFGWIERHGSDENYLMAVKNVNVDGATVTGHHNVAVIAGYLIGTIDNCHVTNATVSCTHANDDACGDKAGVIVGIAAEAKALIKDCSATDCTVTAGRDAGQIVGACIVGKVENCTATDVTVSATGDCTGANINNDVIGRT